jgi:hypothetical protein
MRCSWQDLYAGILPISSLLLGRRTSGFSVTLGYRMVTSLAGYWPTLAKT